MRNLMAVFVAAIAPAGLLAHTVVYDPPGSPMRLTFGGANGAIRVVPGTDDTCVVSASATPATPGLVAVEPPIAIEVTAVLTIRVLRAPSAGTETVRVSGTWFATGNVPDCTGSGPISVDVQVGAVSVTAVPTSANFPNAGLVIEPVSTSTGELVGHDERADLVLGGPLPLELRRYYASFLAANGVRGALGTNWMHNFDLKLFVDRSDATVTLFRGKTVRFSQATGAWRLSSAEQRPYQLLAVDGNYRFFSPVSKRIYTFNAAGGLIRVEDRHGNALTVTQGTSGPTEVSDGLGRRLTFTYTGTNLTRVQDQSGRAVSFEYSGGNLSAFTDANGKRWTYAYTTGPNLTGLLTAETRPAGNIPFTQEYDSQGRVARQIDSKSNAMTLTYTPANNGATVTEPLGFTLTHAHDANRNLTSEADAGGGTSQRTYDSNHRLTSVRDRTGGRRAVTYDAASGLPATFTDELGNTTNLTYAAATRDGFTFHDLLAVRLPGGEVISFTRDERGNVTELTDQLNRKWRATWNARGQILTFSNPAAGVTTFDYDSAARLASIRTDSGDSVGFGYDAAGRPNLITHPDNATAGFLFDALDNLTRFVDERSSPFTAAFDDNNNLRSLTDALAGAVSLTRDTDDLVTRHMNQLGNSTRIVYDALHRAQTITNPVGNTLSFSYDTRNRVGSVVDATNRGLSFIWDNESRLLSVIDPFARTTSVTRDAMGQVTSLTTPNNERYSFSYNSQGEITSSTDPLGRVAQYRYDAAGLLSGFTLPGGVTVSIGRNALGLPATVTDPNGNVWTRAFDKMGRLTSFTDPLGRTTSFQYDGRHRLSRVTTPMGEAQYTYDAAGNLTRASFSDGTTLNYAYDANGRLTGGTGLSLVYDAAGRITQSNGLLNTYDDAGRLTSVTYAAGKSVRYTYNNRGLLSTIVDWLGGTTTFTYDDARQLTSITYPSGVRHDRAYDRNGRIASIRLTRGGAALASITLRRDALGRVISADRSEANVPNVPTGYYPQAFDGAHQSLAAAYDGLGRITADASRRYRWDLAGRLTSYEGADGAASFTYDALGQRISRIPGVTPARHPHANGGAETFIVNYGLGVGPSVINSGSDASYNIFQTNGNPIAVIGSNNLRFDLHFDESGNLFVVTDPTGAVSDTFAVTPGGDFLSRTGSNSFPFNFGGEFGAMREGVTDLLYVGGSWFNATSGQTLGPNPGASQYLEPRYSELFPTVFRRRNQAKPLGDDFTSGVPVAPIPQDALWFPFQSESGFIRAAQNGTGLADYGTRLIARFNNVSSAVQLFTGGVPLQGSNGTGDPVQTGYPAWRYIESMYRRGYTKGVSSTAPASIPRFADTSTSTNLLTINPIRTNLLFPYINNQAGFDTGLVIANTSQDVFGTAPQTGACRLNCFGSSAAIAPSASTAGPMLVATPGFQGYIIAQCSFQYAHGYAFVSDFGARNLAQGYLSLILDQGISESRRNGSAAESLGH